MKYKPPFFIRGAHLETLVPHFFRQVRQRRYTPIIVDTPDNDFLEADHYKTGSKTLTILSHGLEGDSRRDYMIGMTNIFLDHGFDVLCWNYRGCGEMMNRQLRLYHSGATDDLKVIVQKALAMNYERLVLVGFSLGGNLTLKYVGEEGPELPSQIKAAIAFSTPLDLDAGCVQLSKPQNFLYAYRFITKLKNKVRLKHQQYPKYISLDGLSQIKDLRSFDNRYTAPIHGFKDAAEYYKKCSSIYYVDNISIPTLIVNALNDPFLPKECYPEDLPDRNKHITFEAPRHGGHVGFSQFNGKKVYWSEQRAIDFARQVLELI